MKKVQQEQVLTPNLNKLHVLIAGQLLTGRMEVLEKYLKERVRSLLVVGTSSAHSKSTARFYEQGICVQKFYIPSIRLKMGPLIVLIYIVNLLSILYSTLRLRRRFHIFIGIGCFPTLIGIIVKKLKVVEHFIYYSIDYFPSPLRFSFDTLFAKTFVFCDKVCAKGSDVVWNASTSISEARKRFAGLHPEHYQQILVPVGFSSGSLRYLPLKDIERWSIVFAGTYGPFHGLELLVDAMPSIIEQVPNAKVRIIGSGPWDELKRLVNEVGLADRFIFHGFIKEEEELFNMVSRCAIGVAPYTLGNDNPTAYADPGKPKLYAFCGLPTIITKSCAIATEIENRGAGITIDYDLCELVNAVVKLLGDDKTLISYRKNANLFAQSYTSELVLGNAFDSTLCCLHFRRR